MKNFRLNKPCFPRRILNCGHVALVLFTASFSHATLPHESIGPSSRKTPIAISEIMYKPAPRTDEKNLEFLEIYNSNPWFQDISGYQITCADMSYKFPAGTVIASNSIIVLAAVPGDITAIYGITNVMGPYTGSLKKTETAPPTSRETKNSTACAAASARAHSITSVTAPRICRFSPTPPRPWVPIPAR